MSQRLCGFAALLILLVPMFVASQPPLNEVGWSRRLAEENNIPLEALEYYLPNGSRVDIYDEGANIAWEVEWVEKWEQSIGQALYYGIATEATPGVWLLLRGNSDEDYLQCLAVVTKLRCHGIDMKLRTRKISQ